MELINISSGSKGNCYIVKTSNGNFLLDAGIQLERIFRKINLNDIDFCFISHEHKDHSLSKAKLVERGVNVIEGKDVQEFTKIDLNAKYTLFTFPVKHGDEKNGGVIIKTKDELILYITDFTVCKYDLSLFKFTSVMLECNYIDTLMKVDDVKTRRQINTHMSLEGLEIFMSKLDLRNCQNIYLLHLSKGYGDRVEMGVRINNKFHIKTGVCLQEGGIDYYG